ncbi:beta-N-acetylhexosaminidase [Ferruginibacter yonginensis]|uniref:beta-N-acetylhexosaminidase n=1 Tax=Ferruginibacter yonginensis TaxID=1310416 RepID=A0ABV8QNE0_9BACT
MYLKLIITSFFCFCITLLYAQINIIPQPQFVQQSKGSFLINNKTAIIYDQYSKPHALYLQQQLKTNYNITPRVIYYNEIKNLPTQQIISLSVKNNVTNGYALNSTQNNIEIMGVNDTLLFNGLQSLLQLIIQKNCQTYIPSVIIKDAPRFQYRGMHLDVSRHFFNVADVKRYIDYLAFYKFNTFHWHLTDDQGWRIEIKKYPLLTQIGGYRNGTIVGRYPGIGNTNQRYGGFYTQAQIKEVVQYASERFINIIPEIEMPGHASAAIAAYPQLSCFPDEAVEIAPTTIWSGSKKGKHVQQTWGVFNDVFAPTDYTFQFLEDVLDEIIPLFPSTYIHIGGDECPKENWKRSAFCQQLIKDKNLKDEHGLQSYFIQKIEQYLNKKGKKIIGWDEILEGGFAPNAAVMSWRGTEGGVAAAKQQHNVVMTPGSHCYFDHAESQQEDSVTIGGFLPLEKVYRFEPVPSELNKNEAIFILGAQANVWTEYITNTAKLQYMIFPRIAAIAEVLWTNPENKSWLNFEKKIPIIFNQCKKWKANFNKAYYELYADVQPSVDNKSIQLALSSKQPKANIVYKINDGAFKKYEAPLHISTTCSIGYSILIDDKVQKLTKQPFHFNKATGKKIELSVLPSKAYPGNGAFSLVDGIHNTKGLAASAECIGFEGDDVMVKITFNEPTIINNINIHSLYEPGSWVYLPKSISLFNQNMELLQQKEVTNTENIQSVTLLKKITETQIIIKINNYGIIPTGMPGAGNKAWLFLNEIEIN